MTHRPRAVIFVLAMLVAVPAGAQDFTYMPPGSLESGTAGRVDDTVYVPGMRFPIEQGPAYPNSQVYGHGGYLGPGGGQCDPENFSYPWWDNYCEPRDWDMPLCPSGTGHQGQDIRASTCADETHWAVAAEAGTITSIGSFSVTLVSDGGTQHRYLHMKMTRLAVSRGQRVAKGDRMGLVSDDFGGTSTTRHLHYDLNQNVNGVGAAYVPTYMSLVRSYEELIGQEAEPCPQLPAGGGVKDNHDRCFSLFGNPTFWRFVEGQGVENDLYWTNAWTNDTPGNWARWRLNFETAGEYDVAVNTIPEWAKSQEVIYVVKHDNREDTVRVDQTASVDGWAHVGRFTFAAGENDQFVSVYDNTGEDGDLERHIMVDGLRFTPVGVDPPDVGPEPEPEPEPDVGRPDTRPEQDMGADLPEPEEDTRRLLPDVSRPPDAEVLESVGQAKACSCDTAAAPSLWMSLRRR
jgi:murein DD-endopeptidase MepM/ murein hydrolase activator NlpD